MTTFKLPLENTPQQFAIALAGKEYLLSCRWNSAPEGGWFFDFVDAITNVAILSNIPLITGANILEAFDYLKFNGEIIVFTDGDELAVPTLDNLGTESNVYFQTDVVT